MPHTITSSPGLVEALRIYAGQKEPSARSTIYAEAIAPAITANRAIIGPILAANSLGSLAGDLIVQRALTLLKQSFPMLSAISTDFSDASVRYGQTISTRTRGIPTASNYVAGTGYTTSDAATTDVPVTIDNHKGVQISFNVNELGSTSRDLFGEQAEGAHYAIGKALVDAVYALLTVANFDNETVCALSEFGRPKVSSIGRALTDRGVPELGRFILLNHDYASALGDDPSIVSFAAFQRPEIITEGVLPRVSGFQPYSTGTLPVAENLVGFAGTPDALVLATRLPSDYASAIPGASAGNGSLSVVTNPDIGISVQLTQYVDHNKAAAFWRIALMFGVAVGQAASGQRVVSAANS